MATATGGGAVDRAPAADLPRLRAWVTVLCTILVGLVVVSLLVFGTSEARLTSLEHPVESAVRVQERGLELDEIVAQRPAWERLWLLVDVGTTGRDPKSVAADAYREALAKLSEGALKSSDELAGPLRAHLVVLLAESDRWAAAARELSRLEPSEPEQAFAAAVRYAYDETAAGGPPARLDVALSLLAPSWAPRLEPGWAADRLATRLYRRAGSAGTPPAEAHREATERLWRRYAEVTSVFNLVMLAGLVLEGILLLRRQPLPVLADGLRKAPWSLGRGYAVLVRAAFWGGLLALGVTVAWQAGRGGEPPWLTLLAALPMLWLARRLLLRPYGLTLGEAFGLRRPLGGWQALLAATLILIGIEQLCAVLASLLGGALGLEGPWTESIQEQLIWGSGLFAAAFVVEGVVWAPLFEEIGFRGLLYTTLRTRLHPLAAAALTAAPFAALHLYSATGFLTLLSGAVASALVYERTRSLAPCILAHAFNNALALASTLLLYR